jgi:hypothetical protein
MKLGVRDRDGSIPGFPAFPQAYKVLSLKFYHKKAAPVFWALFLPAFQPPWMQAASGAESGSSQKASASFRAQGEERVTQ